MEGLLLLNIILFSFGLCIFFRMSIILIGGNQLSITNLYLPLPLYNIGPKDRYLIEIRVCGAAGI